MVEIRLYRAISKRERIGISSIEIKNMPTLDEIYSHVVSSYKLRKGPLFSFTDKLSVAEKYLKMHPDKYCAIGYIDIKLNEDTGKYQLPKEILSLIRISQEVDWLDLIEQDNKGKAIRNLNYKTSDVNNPVKMFVPSQKGIVSWSRNSSEYVSICNGLKLNIIDSSYVDPLKPIYKEPIKRNRDLFYNYSTYVTNLESLGLKTRVRKEYVEKILIKYKNLCEKKVS